MGMSCQGLLSARSQLFSRLSLVIRALYIQEAKDLRKDLRCIEIVVFKGVISDYVACTVVDEAGTTNGRMLS